MKILYIDLETYSEAPLAKTGAYRYVDDESFEILLLAYAVDAGDPEVVDMASGEAVPDWLEDALTSDEYIKVAHNAQFEWACLQKHTGGKLVPEQWRCSAFMARHAGYPGSLEQAGAALGLAEDKKKKLQTGKALIRYFCVPCKPTKANGGRTRNLPEHAPDKWEQFVTYNRQDVVTEREIVKKLSRFPIPGWLWKQFWTDLIINERGVALDLDLMEGALSISERERAALIAEAAEITGLENPNSLIQLQGWLREHGADLPDMTKDTVAKAAEDESLPPEAHRILQIRRELGKTSTKKYDAMKTCVCHDGRARGLLQFYGASRTGRYCLTGDHEVLTRDGWVRLDEWSGGHIMCWEPTMERLSFQKSEALSFDYSGRMYVYKGQRISQIATPDHKMPVLNKYGVWEPKTAEQIGFSRFMIPFTGTRHSDSRFGSNELRVLIMTQADGFYTTEGSVKYHFTKQRKIERCRMLLRRCGIVYNEKRHEKSNATIFTVPRRVMPLWLRQFRDKNFGYWLLDENLEVLFEELPLWDGYKCGPNSIQYATTNKNNADIIQACALCRGMSATVVVKEWQQEARNTAYYVNVWLTPGHGTAIRREQISTIDVENIKVYCAKTSTGYFVVRREGRVWITGNSGKNIQLQNLPRTYTKAIEFARECVQKADGDVLALMYGSVQDTLSQLIRTAFVPAPGHVFIDADFSAIEARVLAWLSGEDWVLQAFRDGKDLYCATASAMFHVPVEKHGQNAGLRQKGKIAVLACIAGDEWVATDHGMVPIRDVTKDMKVYDGHGYVEHGGVIYRGVRRVIQVNGVRMTPDHLVLTDRGWVPAEDCDGLRGPEGSQLVYEMEPPFLFDYDHVYDILDCGPDNRFTVVNRETREYIPVHNCGYGGGVGAMTAMGALDMGIPEDELPGIVDQWRQANAHTKALWYEVQDAVDGAVYEYRASDVAGGKVRIGLEYNPDTETKYLTVRLPSGRVLYYPSPVQTTNRFGSPSIAYMGVNQTTRAWTLIETYGAKIVENITQAIARDLLAEAIERLEAAGLPVVFHVHDEVVIDVARFGTDKEMLDRVCRIMSEVPEWAEGLPLAADGWVGLFFTKD